MYPLKTFHVSISNQNCSRKEPYVPVKGAAILDLPMMQCEWHGWLFFSFSCNPGKNVYFQQLRGEIQLFFFFPNILSTDPTILTICLKELILRLVSIFFFSYKAARSERLSYKFENNLCSSINRWHLDFFLRFGTEKWSGPWTNIDMYHGISDGIGNDFWGSSIGSAFLPLLALCCQCAP